MKNRFRSIQFSDRFLYTDHDRFKIGTTQYNNNTPFIKKWLLLGAFFLYH